MNVKKLFLVVLFLSISVSIQAQIQLTLPTISGNPGTESIVNFTVNDITSYRVQGYQFKIHFDPTIIRFSNPGNNQAGTISSGASTQISTDTNYIKTGYINVVSIKGSDYTGSGALFSLKVKFMAVGTSTITLASNDDSFTSKIFDYNLQNLTFNTTNGNATCSTAPQYTITTSSNPAAGGTISGSGTYTSGNSVTVIATVNSGYSFVNWTEGSNIVSTNASYTFTISASRTLVANFAQQYTIATSSNPTNGGTTTGNGIYNSRSSATVIATPSSGFSFVNWTEGGTIVSTSASYTFTVSGNRTLVANFDSQFTITTSSNPTAGGTTSGSGIYYSGTSVTVTATANNGYSFINWTEGSNIVSTNASYTFTVSGARNLVANFVQPLTVTTSSNPAAGGTTSGGGIYFYGQSITVNATANSGYAFVNWTENGTVVSTSASYNFTLNSSKNLVANFTQQYTITTSSNPTNGGTTSGGGQFFAGQSVTVAATAATGSGYNFLNWTEGGTVVSTNASYTFTASSNRTLVANFTQQIVVTTLSDPSAGGTTTGGGTYSSNSLVTISATPNSGYSFLSWTENGSIVTVNSSYTFIVTGNRTFVANFALLPALVVSPSSLQVTEAAGIKSLSVSNATTGTMDWTAAVTSGSSWLTIASGSSGTNSGTIIIGYLANTGAARTGMITVTAAGASGSPVTIEVHQDKAVDVREIGSGIPTDYNLSQNYPNPFNPSTKIEFSIPNQDFVLLKVYDLVGKEVGTLVNQVLSAGTYSFNFNAYKLNTGVYFYKITTSNFTSTKKMLLMK